MSFERKRQERKEKKRTKISLLDPDNDEKKNRDVSQSVFFRLQLVFVMKIKFHVAKSDIRWLYILNAVEQVNKKKSEAQKLPGNHCICSLCK